jgi:hypothetical protein
LVAFPLIVWAAVCGRLGCGGVCGRLCVGAWGVGGCGRLCVGAWGVWGGREPLCVAQG